MKSKQLEKGIQQLTDEGVAQLFIMNPGNRKVVGTVGELQFEVIQYRLEHEYGAKASFVPKRFHKACWLTGDEAQVESSSASKSPKWRSTKTETTCIWLLLSSSWIWNKATSQKSRSTPLLSSRPPKLCEFPWWGGLPCYL